MTRLTPLAARFSLVKLATLEVRHEPARGYATAQQAVNAVAGLRSGRGGGLPVLGRTSTDEALALAGLVGAMLAAVRRG